ncbi:SA1002 family membrane protein [Staphylococcus aureus]|uniref:SA1002 family membrane protein n=1 Tax=Staphylococcus aureus TaxID=1280 RepID=UPI00201A9CB3|nr:hypothetical protein [Staphylococcus aureus]MCL4579086.1 hypothetical protein [Staphylococcus aureus]MCO4459987.1 hypothetical protein [Staphylococcus aureus]UXT63370.1 hypothetical protein MUA94_03840 [Staphylococcus aureus]
MLKVIILLILLCILSLIVTNKKEPFLFVKTLMYGAVFVFLGYISLALSAVILLIISETFNISENGSYFFIGLIQILLAAIIQLPLIKLFLCKKRLPSKEISVLEHYVQWAVIYFAIYQAFVENLKVEDIDFKSLHMIFLDPANLNIAFLPTLILTWVTIFNYKMKL